MFSFYHLPSTIVNHPIHKMLYVAYLFHCFYTVTPLKQLIYDALVLAKKVGQAFFKGGVLFAWLFKKLLLLFLGSVSCAKGWL